MTKTEENTIGSRMRSGLTVVNRTQDSRLERL